MLRLDFDSNKIIIPNTRSLFEESVNALNAGAKRAAVLSLWVAVFFDILERITLMADSNNNARSYIKSYEKAATEMGDSRRWKNMQQIEHNILKIALEFEIIDPDEEIALTRLYEDRNRCAHPHPKGSLNTQFTPSRPEVYAHLDFAYVQLFTRHPLEKSKKMTEILSNEICSLTWPQKKSVKEYLKTHYFNRLTETGRRRLTQLFIKSTLTPPDISSIPDVQVQEDTVFFRFRHASRMIKEIDYSLFFSVLKDATDRAEDNGKVNSEYLCRLISLAGDYPEMWESLSDSIRAKIYSLMHGTSDSELSGRLAKMDFFDGHPIDSGDEQNDTKYLELLNGLRGEYLYTAIRRAYNKAKFKTAIFNNLRSVDSWREATKAAALLTNVAYSLTVKDIEELTEIICYHSGSTYNYNQIVNAEGVDQALEESFLSTETRDIEILKAWQNLSQKMKEVIHPTYFQGKEPPYGEFQKQIEEALNSIN